ncbi:MAG: hypothetical protein KA413_00425 [Candidatus Methylopumilus sp.]|nr:hypothetical protein [Candidatus Methylopumilus sp.]
MKNLIIILAFVLVGCGSAQNSNNQQSIIKLSVTDKATVRAALGEPVEEQGNVEGYSKYCKVQQKCYQGYNRVELDQFSTSVPQVPVKCVDVCVCVVSYDDNGKVNSCNGCVEELCKI